MSRPLCFHPLALSRWDRIALHAEKVLGFLPNVEPAPGRPSKKIGNRYGHLLACARKFVAGGYGSDSVHDVASAEELDHGSLKSTVWRLQSEARKAKKKGRAA